MDPSNRILDANFNRAREAARVVEDFARFGLNDAALAAATKALRHGLADVLLALGAADMVRARDVPGDLGRDLSAPGEYQRARPADVAIAACKRLSEALRVIEEFAKLRDPAPARRVEQLRYAAYDIERQLSVRLNPDHRIAALRLYVIITESLCRGDWLETAEAALRGGADALQLREKQLDGGEWLERARRLARLCHDRGALCIINDRADIAAAAGADGVHVGQTDLPASAARRLLPTGHIVGVSTHNVEQVRAAAAASPDYIAVGPMFRSTTKAIEEVPGPGFWKAARAETSLPLAAIGGIGPDTLPALMAAGCGRVCVCQAVIAQPDPEAAARALRAQLGSAARPGGPAA